VAEKPDTFAARLKALRESATLSVAELAERSGLARTHVHHLEAGTRQPDFATVLKLCEGLKVKLRVFEGCEG
jgi:transcriptional regulator with XRE-family HTH domain